MSLQSAYQELFNVFAKTANYEFWHQIDDSVVFGIKDEDSEEIFWCGFIGGLNELRGIVLHRGELGLKSFIQFFKVDPEIYDYEIALNQNCILLTMDQEDLIGDELWPFYEEVEAKPVEEGYYLTPLSYRPGKQVRFCNSEELEQTSQILGRFLKFLTSMKGVKLRIDGPNFFLLPDENPQMEESESYRVDYKDYLPDPKANVELPISATFKELLGHPKLTGAIWQAELAYSPVPIGDGPGGEVYHPKMIMMTDLETGQIMFQDLFAYGEYTQDRLVSKFLTGIQKCETCACEIQVKSEELFLIFQDLFRETAIDIVQVEKLDSINEAMQAMVEFFANPPEDMG